MQDVLTEGRAQAGELRIHSPQPPLARVIQLCAGPHEVLVVALYEAMRLRPEVEIMPIFINSTDPREQLRVQQDLITVRGEPWGQLRSKRLEFVVRMRRYHVREQG